MEEDQRRQRLTRRSCVGPEQTAHLWGEWRRVSESVCTRQAPCAVKWCVQQTHSPLCLGCHSSGPSAHVIYLSTSKLQWTLSGHLKMEAGLLGGVPASFTHLTVITLGYCFCLLCASPPEFIPWQHASGSGALMHLPMLLLVKTQ